ncbi:MAG: hypothetical protein U1F56_12275 [Rubrivivax sp.]
MNTVCTVTVNSPDEQQVLRRHLDPKRWRFVELVEHGRSDWLDAACRSRVRCDVLVISGHYDGGHQFFSDRLDVGEHLPVAELERASCTASCSGLFAQLKEVHLYGCNTLNPQPQTSAGAEALRSLVRERAGTGAHDSELPRVEAGPGESSRERMRQIFPGVPAIYGFASMAPLGPVAAEPLERWLRNGGRAEVGRGRSSSALLAAFGPQSFTVVRGLGPDEPLARSRAHMCALSDGDRPLAQRVAAAHRLLQRDVTGVGVHLDRIQRLLAEVPDGERATGEVARAFERVAADGAARSRWLASIRETYNPTLRLRLIDVAAAAGWFTPDERRAERVRLLSELRERRDIGVGEVDLACALDRDHELEGPMDRSAGDGSGGPDGDTLAQAALRACGGSADARRRVLAALAGGDPADTAVAQAYLRRRPIGDGDELRRVADAVMRMPPSDAQVRALGTLARHYLSDRALLQELVHLFEATPSAEVQAAVAGILIRADRQALDVPALLELLQRHRRGAQPIVDALVRRLQAG